MEDSNLFFHVEDLGLLGLDLLLELLVLVVQHELDLLQLFRLFQGERGGFRELIIKGWDYGGGNLVNIEAMTMPRSGPSDIRGELVVDRLEIIRLNGNVHVRSPENGDSISHGARLVHQIISMMKWIQTSRLSTQNSLSPAT